MEIIQNCYGIDPLAAASEQVTQKLKEHKLEVEQEGNIARGIDKLWKNIREDVAGPVWLVNIPT